MARAGAAALRRPPTPGHERRGDVRRRRRRESRLSLQPDGHGGRRAGGALLRRRRIPRPLGPHPGGLAHRRAHRNRALARHAPALTARADAAPCWLFRGSGYRVASVHRVTLVRLSWVGSKDGAPRAPDLSRVFAASLRWTAYGRRSVRMSEPVFEQCAVEAEVDPRCLLRTIRESVREVVEGVL